MNNWQGNLWLVAWRGKYLMHRRSKDLQAFFVGFMTPSQDVLEMHDSCAICFSKTYSSE